MTAYFFEEHSHFNVLLLAVLKKSVFSEQYSLKQYSYKIIYASNVDSFFQDFLHFILSDATVSELKQHSIPQTMGRGGAICTPTKNFQNFGASLSEFLALGTRRCPQIRRRYNLFVLYRFIRATVLAAFFPWWSNKRYRRSTKWK